jgi:hypothetical protein
MEEPFINVYLVLKTSISLMMEMPDTRKEIGFSGDISTCSLLRLQKPFLISDPDYLPTLFIGSLGYVGKELKCALYSSESW